MIRFIISAVIAFSVSSAFSKSDDELIKHFTNFEAVFEECTDTFDSARAGFPSLNHIDLEGHSPRSIEVKKEILNRQRELLTELHIRSVMKGDFSDLGLTDTVYLLVEEENIELEELDEHYGIQRGYVRTDSSIEPLVTVLGESKKTEYIEFVSIAKGWYLYERKYNHELINHGPFILDK
jgi:hypothetical protein